MPNQPWLKKIQIFWLALSVPHSPSGGSRKHPFPPTPHPHLSSWIKSGFRYQEEGGMRQCLPHSPSFQMGKQRSRTFQSPPWRADTSPSSTSLNTYQLVNIKRKLYNTTSSYAPEPALINAVGYLVMKTLVINPNKFWIMFLNAH